MHSKSIHKWRHDHDYSVANEFGEKRTTWVLWLTAITMVAEIVAGTVYGSMALLADGWHMGTHVAAFLITLFAYRYARKHANNPAFTFGTGKVTVLGGFASAILLAAVAALMVIESIHRLLNPEQIGFNQAITVAIIGLVVNLASALLLQDHHHHHHHDEEDERHHHHEDHNLKAAYLHVLADALTSILAISALFAGKYLGWLWLDSLMGIVGGVVITVWAVGLIKETSPILLDSSIDEDYARAIQERIEADSDNRIYDLHVWKVGPHHYSLIVAFATHFPKPIEYYHDLLRDFDRLSHMTIEINHFRSEPCIETKNPA